MCCSVRNTSGKRLDNTCVLTATSPYLEICNELENFHFLHCSEEEKSDNLPKPDSGEKGTQKGCSWTASWSFQGPVQRRTYGPIRGPVQRRVREGDDGRKNEI